MPIYTEKDKTYLELKQYINNGYVCGECGSAVTLCSGGSYGYEGLILKCAKDLIHKTLSRPFTLSPTNTPGFNLYDAGKKRREKLEKQIGETRAVALRKYQGVITLNRTQASEIMEAIWPGAPVAEKTRAAILCVDYQLNPLMKHIFLVPFNKGKPNESWVTVMGINATRLLAARKGTFSYVDDTPRIMTSEEQIRRFGKSYSDRIYVIVKVKDPKTGAEAPGLGWWPNSQAAYGEEKGNTQFNMAAIRAERQALSRLRPGEMPNDIEVMEDSIAEIASVEGIDDVINGEATEVKDGTTIEQPAEKEHWCPIHNTEFFKRGKMKWYAHSYKDSEGKDIWCSENKVMKNVENDKGSNSNYFPDDSKNHTTSDLAGVTPPDKLETTNSMDKPNRDTETIKTFTDLYKACLMDWPQAFKSSKDVVKELGYSSQTDIAITPAECYQQIADTRQ